jgi:hypothetical protein
MQEVGGTEHGMERQMEIAGTDYCEEDFYQPLKRFMYDCTPSWYQRQRGAVQYLAAVLTRLAREMEDACADQDELRPVRGIISEYAKPSSMERRQMFKKLRQFCIRTGQTTTAYPDTHGLIYKVIADNYNRQLKSIFFRALFIESQGQIDFIKKGY